MTQPLELRAEQLRRRCDPAGFDFETTASLADLDEVLGQPRAVAAVEFAVGIDRDGYNLYALGTTGTGKHAVVRRFLEQRARERPVPPDWCYVHNFEAEHQPRLLQLPAGRGGELRRDLERLVRELATTLVGAFESDEYQNRR